MRRRFRSILPFSCAFLLLAAWLAAGLPGPAGAQSPESGSAAPETSAPAGEPPAAAPAAAEPAPPQAQPAEPPQRSSAERRRSAAEKRDSAAARRKALEEAGLSAAQIEDLISTLESPDGRDRFISRLKALRAAAEGEPEAPEDKSKSSRFGGRFVATLSDRIEAISEELVAGAGFVVDAPRLVGWVKRQISDPVQQELWIRVLWKLLVVLAAGLIAEWAVRALLARPRHAIEGQSRDGWWLRLPFLVARTFLDVMPIVAFAGAAYIVLPLVDPSEVTRLVAISLVNASVVARAVMAIARMFFVPRATNLRILKLRDEDANYVVVWVRRITNVAVYGYFIAEAGLLLGMPEAGYAALTKLIGLLLALLIMIFILQNRHVVADWIRGPEREAMPGITMIRRRFADIWHVLAIIYVFAVYVVWALEIEGGFDFVFRATMLSIVILVAAKLLVVASRNAVDRGFGLREELVEQFPGLSVRANRYFRLLHVFITIAVCVIAAFAILEAWGVDSFAWISTPIGRRVTGSVLTSAFVIAIAILFWEMTSSVIERYLARGEKGEVTLSARAKTLLPLLRKTLMIVISTIVGFIVLSEIGVNIGPLLAGAGVVGLAIGFGSQTLVKDVITGVFILAEDQFSVGDVVSVDGKAGLVEDITIRTIRLRDLGGSVHIIPFSVVTSVENMTKDFSRYVFDVGIAYREDVDEVIEVLRGLGEEMEADEYFGTLIIQGLEVLGLDSFGDSAIVIKARITTLPIKQWEVGREFNRRMKRRFDELGIEIPFPHQTVYFGENKGGGAPPAFVEINRAPEPPKKIDAPDTPNSGGDTPSTHVDNVDLPAEEDH